MSRLLRITIGILVLVFSFGSAPLGSVGIDSSGAARPVVIKNFEFSPRTVMIAAGEAVRWTNMDVANHQITSGVADGRDRPRPDGRVVSPLLFRGEEFSATLPAPGEYRYFCRIHPFMRGTVIVTPEMR